MPSKSGPSSRSEKAVQLEPERPWKKDLWNRWVLSLEKKAERMTDGESEEGDCEGRRWCDEDEVNQEKNG